MKKIKLNILLICLLAIMVSLTSCVYSKNPLGNKERAIIDPNLLGIWYMTEEQDPETEHYLAVSMDPDGFLKFITFDNLGTEPGEMRGYITEIQGDRYLNLQMINIKGGSREPEDEYIFAHYYIDSDNQLVYAAFNTKFFEEAVEGRDIEGELPNRDKLFSSLKLTDSTENIVKFLEKHRKKDYLDEDEQILKNLRRSPMPAN